MANIWVHNGFVNINNEKMSKSLGNSFNVKEVLKIYPPEVVRFFLVSKHYRSPLDFSEESLTESWRALERIYRTLAQIPESVAVQAGEPEDITGFQARYLEAMNDDLNTAQAMGVIFELVRAVNRFLKDGNLDSAVCGRRTLMDLGSRLNLWQEDPQTFLSRPRPWSGTAAQEVIETLVKSRAEARSRRDWAEADRLRAELTGLGVVVEDKAGQSSWRYA
jgi:cysteinyl-tRNA synthetase